MFNANKYTCKCWVLNIYEQVKGLHPELTAFANASKLELQEHIFIPQQCTSTCLQT